MGRFFRFGPWIAVLILAMGAFGCGEEPAEQTPEAPAVDAEEQRRAAEAARRQEETAALAQRASGLEEEVASLVGGVGSAQDLPAELGSRVATATAKAEEVRRLAAELEQQSGEAWEATQQSLETALGELESARSQAAAAVGEWQQKEAEAQAARSEGESPINPETGLIEGLDEGQYDQYLVSVVQRVQQRLRREGLYAGPVDGIFGRATLEAVGAYQESQELHVSGVPSPMTRARLFSDG